MSGRKAESRAKGLNVVVGTGGFGFVGDRDGGPGRRSYGGGGRNRRDGDSNGRLVKWGGYCSNHKLSDRA